MLKAPSAATDAKTLKDLCSVIKEVIAITSSLEKENENSSDTIRIIMEGDVTELAR